MLLWQRIFCAATADQQLNLTKIIATKLSSVIDAEANVNELVIGYLISIYECARVRMPLGTAHSLFSVIIVTSQY